MKLPIVILAFISVYTITTPKGFAATITCVDDFVFLPNPDDCNSFYVCSNTEPILHVCPTVLNGTFTVFDPTLSYCVWPDEYDCSPTRPPQTTRPATTTTKATTTTTRPTTTTTRPTTTTTRPTSTTTRSTTTTTRPTTTTTRPTTTTTRPTTTTTRPTTTTTRPTTTTTRPTTTTAIPATTTTIQTTTTTRTTTTTASTTTTATTTTALQSSSLSPEIITKPTEEPPETTANITNTTETATTPSPTTTKRPETTTPAVDTEIETTNGPTLPGEFIQCNEQTYLVNPYDCNSFYQCTNGVPYLLYCGHSHGEPLVFDPNLNVCVWSSDYDCSDSTGATWS